MDALCIMTSLLAGLCHQVKAPHSVQREKHSAWPEVPMTGEPIKSLLRVPAAGTENPIEPTPPLNPPSFYNFPMGRVSSKISDFRETPRPLE